MSVDYYLNSKKIYRNLSYNLKQIIELYSEFIELTENEEDMCNYNKDEDIKTLLTIKNNYEDKLREITFFKGFVTNKIYELCEHDFVQDTIDITPDSSKEITYCSLCEYTK